METRLIKIDELSIRDHFYLVLDEDECYYFGSYFSSDVMNPDNSIIYNIKKKPSSAGMSGYHYKQRDIEKVAKIFQNALSNNINGITFVPVPPSKIKGHPDYDDRMVKILTLAFKDRGGDIRELIVQKRSRQASHELDRKRDVQELEDNFQINENEVANLNSTVFVVDDVITTGAHFKAIKNMLQRRFKNLNIIGLFICRRVLIHDFEE